MTEKDHRPGQEKPGGSNKAVYGTRIASSVTDRPSPPTPTGTMNLNADRTRPQTPDRPAFGTRAAPPVAQSAFGDAGALDNRQLPSYTNMRAVTQTQRADGSQLNLLAALAKAQQGSPVAVPLAVSESGRTVRLRPGLAAAVPEHRTAGKSTWNLRIHRRDVDGHISGIVNEIPKDATGTTGLQSALATHDSAPEYEILGQLGAGNMGIVYRARQLSLNRELAIKTLKPESNSAEHDQAMFVSEAVVTANLVHPNIVPIHDLGRTADGKLFYSMKKVMGVSWNDLIRQRSLEDNIDVFMKLCDAVAYAHSRGVINRDLKPENVVVGEYGEVVVLDWGLAITTDLFEKRNSVIVDFKGGAGTPVYMAPELIDEDINSIGPYSDIYLLGAILFEVLEGFAPHLLRSLWDLTDPEDQLNGVIWAVIHNEIEPDCVNNGELMQIARRCMATDPNDRYPSVEALQEAIREYRITGRAEELLTSVDPRTASEYAEYQSSVALYSEALRKWPANQRAIEGDRRARLAYAQLALNKGDIDLGLQVVAHQTEESFLPVIAKLKKSRRVRRLVRGTWGVMTVAAVTLLLVSTVLWLGAVEKTNELVAINGELGEARKKFQAEQKNTQEQKDIAANEIKNAEAAKIEATAATKKAADETLRASEATLAADAAKKDADKSKQEAEAAKEVAATETLKAEKSQKDAEAALVTADMANTLAEEASVRADKALQDTYKYELDGYSKLIDASQQLGDYNDVIRLAREVMAKAETNPLISKKKDHFQLKIDDAVSNGGNAEIPLDHKPDSAAISADGSTVVVYSRGAQPRLSVVRSESGPLSVAMAAPQPLTPPKGAVRDLTLSHDGHCLCLVGKEKQLWQLQNGSFKQLKLSDFFPGSENTKASGRTFGHALFSGDGKHLFLVGADERATVEIYSIGSDSAKLLLPPQPLSGIATGGLEIRDVVLLPDMSALIAQTERQECFAYLMNWDTGVPVFGELSVRAPKLKPFVVSGQPLSVNKPNRLFVSNDGQHLALAFAETVVVLPRATTTSEFPFSIPDQAVPVTTVFRCSFAVTDLSFSADGQRIATGHGSRYIQLWDRLENLWVPCETEGLFSHRSTRDGQEVKLAASLRGHSEVVKSIVFSAGDADRLISVSADQSIRTWKISAYGELVSRVNELRDMLQPKAAGPPAVSRLESGIPTVPDQAVSPSKSFVVQASAQAPEQQRSNQTLTSSTRRWLTQPLLTVAPLPQPPASAVPQKIQQGRDVFSARFSPNADRVLIGADDLAAHIFDSQSGKRVLTASMSGRKDLFFDPDRNNFLEGHISEIASIRFLPPSGELLLSADYFGSISVWDALADENGIGIERSRLLSEYSSSEFAVSDDGSLILAGGASTTNPDASLGSPDADLKHMGVIWRTADILQSPNPVAFLKLEGQHTEDAITAVAISPLAERVVTAGRRGKIVVWDAKNGSVIASIATSHDKDQVSGIFFETENQLVSVGYDGTIWRRTITGDSLTSTEVGGRGDQLAPDFIIRLRPSPDRTRFVTSEVATSQGSGLLNIMIWSADGVRPLLSSPIKISKTDSEKAFRHDISWSSDGRELMLVADGAITVFETTGWTVIRKFHQNIGGLKAVRGVIAPALDGQNGRVATFDGRFTHLWDLETGAHLAEFRSHAQYNITAAFSADQRFVATASETLRIFDGDENSPEFGSTMFRLPVREPHRSPLADVAFSPVAGDQRLASIDNRGTLEVWQFTPGKERTLTPVFDAASTEAMSPDWATDLISGNAIAWSPDGQAVAALQLGTLSLWRFVNDQPVKSDFPMPEGLQCRFNQFDFSAKNGLLTAGGVASNTASNELSSFAAVWSLADNQAPRLVATITGAHSVDTAPDRPIGITAIAFDDQHNEIVTGGADTRLIRWGLERQDQDSVTPLDRIADFLIEGTSAHKSPVTAVDAAADGRIVTADSSGIFILWPTR